MPDLMTLAGGPSETASSPTTSKGITLTAGGTNHVKNTTWTEFFASTAFQTSWLYVMCGDVSSNNVQFMIDIGVGASTAEVAVINNLTYRAKGIADVTGACWLFPLRIPRGTRVSARCQCSTASATVDVNLTLIAAPIAAPITGTRVETFGAVTGTTRGTTLNDPGAVAHTDGTWTEMLASTAFAYKWLAMTVFNANDSAYSAAMTNLLDIGVGAGGAEVELISDLAFTGNVGPDSPGPHAICVPVNIAAGSRIVARHRTSTTTAGERRLEVVMYGVG